MATSTATDSLHHDPLLGRTVGNRYAIERLIGRGGVGLVYLAHDRKERRQVVVKVLAPHWAEDRDAVARFDREARRMSELDHVNVVKMYDHGHFEGRTYIVMEFIRGEPPRRYLNRRKRLPLEEFIPIAAQILLGAGYVHERGIMLRDIKPPNIMLSEHGGKANHVKMLDFGLARLIDEDEDDEITEAHVIGTAAYMSPEQIKGEKLDVRVDVYALGVLFFLMLTGETPISGDHDAAVLVNHVHGKPKSLAERLPSTHRIPAQLIELIESCLAKDADDRPNDATAMAEALFEFIPAPLFELPDANKKTRAAAEKYWSARMTSGPASVAALQSDTNDSAEWTRPLLRKAAKTGEAPLKLAEEELASMRDKAQQMPPQVAKPKVPRPKKPKPTAAVKGKRPPPPPRPARTGVTMVPRGKTRPPVSPVAAARKQPEAGPLSAPTSATIRVTAADAKEAVERLEAQALVPRADSELSDVLTIDVDDDPSEPTLEANKDTGALDNPPGAALPTSPVAAGATDAVTITPSYPEERRDNGMRLGIIVAVAGLAALALGGLSAFLILDSEESAAAAAPPPAEAPATPAADAEIPSAPVAQPTPTPANIGTVEVRAVDGARVEVDGEDRGEAPVQLELPLGEHRVRVFAPDYYPWESTIDVSAGANAAVKAELVMREEPIEPPPENPTGTPKSRGKRPKSGAGKPPSNSTPRSDSAKPKKSKPKSDVFMQSSKKDDKGIFLPVGGGK